MADIEIVTGEFGDSYDITIYDDETESPADLENFDTITMTVKPTDLSSTILSVNLSKVSGGVVRWSITSLQTASLAAGDYIAQIEMVDTSVTVRRKTKHMTMRILDSL
jgi:hypothetical protein